MPWITTDNHGTHTLSDDALDRIREQIRDREEEFYSLDDSFEVDANPYTGDFSLSFGQSTSGGSEMPSFRDTMNWREKDVSDRLKHNYVHGPIMTDFELIRWLYNYVKDNHSRATAVNAYKGDLATTDANGFDGLMVQACEGASSRIEEEYEINGGNPVAAFNSASASSWPNKARAYLAKFQLLEGQTFGDEDYEDDLREFVEVTPIDSDWEPEESSLGPFDYSEDPRNSHLPIGGIDTVIMLRLVDEDLSGIDIGDIQLHSRFCDWYERLGDASEAIQYYHLDPDVDSAVIDAVAPADEWPDDMNPSDIQEARCTCCGTHYLKIYNEERGVCHITDSGDFREVITDTEEQGYIATQSDNTFTPSEKICSSCAEVSDSNRTAVYRDGDDVYRVHQISGPVLKDDGAEYEDISSLQDAPHHIKEIMVGETRGGRPGTIISMTPGDGPSGYEEQRSALGELLDNPHKLPDNVSVSGITHFGDLEANIAFEADNTDAARAAKNVLEEPETVLV